MVFAFCYLFCAKSVKGIKLLPGVSFFVFREDVYYVADGLPVAAALLVVDDDDWGVGVGGGGYLAVFGVTNHDSSEGHIIFWIKIAAGKMKVFEDISFVIGIFISCC